MRFKLVVDPYKEKFERRSSSIQSKVNQNYPINLLDRTAQVSIKDLFELDKFQLS